jgi:hypothetical protein
LDHGPRTVTIVIFLVHVVGENTFMTLLSQHHISKLT